MAVLGTIRADGSPRVSPIGVTFVDDEVVIGVMARSGKARDLRDDPRFALQSIVTDPEAGEPELKLYGRAEPSDAEVGWPGADVYRLVLDEAVYIEWDLAGSSMRIRRWRPGRAESVTERGYP